MDNLIDRQAAIDALCDEYCGGWQDCKHYPKCENLKAIQNLPSAQPKRGHWVKDAGKWMCDRCGELVLDDDHNFCPNCGAKMEK